LINPIRHRRAASAAFLAWAFHIGNVGANDAK
jgi:hypothetical protein